MTDAQIAELIEEIKNKCGKVVGLEKEAEQGGGNIFFQAATSTHFLHNFYA